MPILTRLIVLARLHEIRVHTRYLPIYIAEQIAEDEVAHGGSLQSPFSGVLFVSLQSYRHDITLSFTIMYISVIFYKSQCIRSCTCQQSLTLKDHDHDMDHFETLPIFYTIKYFLIDEKNV